MKVMFFFSCGFDIEHSSTAIMTNVLEDCLKRNLEIHYIVPNVTGSEKNYPNFYTKNVALTYDVVYQKPIEKQHLIKRYLNGITYALRSIKYIKKQKDIDVIYIQSTPTAFWNVLVAKIFGHGKPIIYSVLDMFPGSTIASGAMPQKPLQIFFEFIQKIAYKMSDQLMCMSDDMKTKLIEQHVSSNKIQPFYTWFDNNSLKKVKDHENSFISEFNMCKKDKFYVQYAGNAGYVFDVDTFLRVANSLKDDETIVFQLVARGHQLDVIKKYIINNNLPNIEIIPIQPVSRISEVYSSCDIQFIPLKRGVMGNSFPSKIAHVMACQKTFICSIDKTYFFELANKKAFGICKEIGNIEGISEVIRELSKNKELLNKYELNALNYAKEKYSREANTKIIIDTIFKMKEGKK